MHLGKVRWWNGLRGFGFIQPEDGSPDVFVHCSSVIVDEDVRPLHDGQAVEYDLVKTGKGVEALNVKRLPEGYPKSPSAL
jgi:CspA family cold shock protein